jgi:hypothetical protein
MKLVYEGTQVPVQVGDTVQVDNKTFVVYSITKPHKPSSTGRVQCRGTRLADARWVFSEWFPSVIGAEWIEREDQDWAKS